MGRKDGTIEDKQINKLAATLSLLGHMKIVLDLEYSFSFYFHVPAYLIPI